MSHCLIGHFEESDHLINLHEPLLHFLLICFEIDGTISVTENQFENLLSIKLCNVNYSFSNVFVLAHLCKLLIVLTLISMILLRFTIPKIDALCNSPYLVV